MKVHPAIVAEFEQLKQHQQSLELQLDELITSTRPAKPVNEQVDDCMAALDRICQLAGDQKSYAEAKELFDLVNARMFLKFQREYSGEVRKSGPEFSNQLVRGTVTFGDAPLPIEIYS